MADDIQERTRGIIARYQIHNFKPFYGVGADGERAPEPIWAFDFADEYHTFTELYEHRHALFAALCKIYDGYITPLGATPVRAWKSKLHADGTMYEGWFIAGLRRKNIDNTELQLSYHLPERYWDNISALELPRAPEWDGHGSKEVIERLLKL